MTANINYNGIILTVSGFEMGGKKHIDTIYFRDMEITELLEAFNVNLDELACLFENYFKS